MGTVESEIERKEQLVMYVIDGWVYYEDENTGELINSGVTAEEMFSLC